MALITDMLCQELADKCADCWSDVHTAEQRLVDFFEVITASDDEDVETDLGEPAEIVDINLKSGLQFHAKTAALLSALNLHVAQVGGYNGVQPYLEARHWRFHRYAADRCWGDANIGTGLARVQVCPEDTNICGHVRGTGYTDIGEIAATAGPGRLRANVIAKGLEEWTPDVHAACEGPASTLATAIDATATTISLVDATNFPDSGVVFIDGEAIAHTGKSDNDLTGCTRHSLETSAAAHLTGAGVYLVHTYTPTVRASARAGLLVDMDAASLTALSVAGAAILNSTGIGGDGTDWVVGNYLLVKDHSCPELLTEACAKDDHVHVADTSAFSPGDHVMIYDTTPQTEWATVKGVNAHDKIITLDAATSNTYTLAKTPIICLAYTSLNEEAVLTYDDTSITLTDSTGFPTVGTILIDGDEEVTYTGNADNILTGCGRGANSTVATAHEDGAVVVLVQAGSFPGHNEVHTVSVIASDTLTLGANLLHSYHTAGYVVPLLRDVVLSADGSGGTAPDEIYVMAVSDRLIHKAG